MRSWVIESRPSVLDRADHRAKEEDPLIVGATGYCGAGQSVARPAESVGAVRGGYKPIYDGLMIGKAKVN
jgi:hypothetical protein